MDRIAVFGWDEATRPQLEVLERVAGLRPIAVGDRRPAALVRARRATGLPCYQHVLEMLRAADYDAALINAATGGAQAVQAAAARGAALLVVGAHADAATLMEAAEAALRYRVPLTILRPRLRQAGLAFTLGLAAADARWRPRYLDLAIAGGVSPGATGAAALLRDAVAIACALFGASPAQVVGSPLGDDVEEPSAIGVHLRYAGGGLASLHLRESTEDRLTLIIESDAGTLELAHAGAAATLTMTTPDGRRETSALVDGDTFALEAERARDAAGEPAMDVLRATHEGATLQAIELAVASGYVVPVQERSSRANLRLVEAGTAAPTAPRGRVHAVSR